MHFNVLGALEVRTGDTTLRMKPGKPTKLLARLLLQRNRWVSVPDLIGSLWPEHQAPRSAQGNIKSYVCGLRRTLPEARIESREGAYRIVTAPQEVDADVAMGRAAEVRRSLADPARAMVLIEDTLALWRGTPFEELAVDVGAAELTWLHEVHWELKENLALTYRAVGRLADAIGLLRSMTAEEPLREGNWTQLVRVLHDVGRTGEALNAYRTARLVLTRELGIEPGEELAAAHQAVLRGPSRRRTANPDQLAS